MAMYQRMLYLLLIVVSLLNFIKGQEPVTKPAGSDPEIDFITAPVLSEVSPSSRREGKEGDGTDDALNNIDTSSLDKGCICVEYYRCDEKDIPHPSDGSDIIDLREAQTHLKKCGTFSVCCKNPLPPTSSPPLTPPEDITPPGTNNPLGPKTQHGPDNPPGPSEEPINEEPPTQAPSTCGVRNVNGLISNRIVNMNLLNDDTKLGEFPWQAAIIENKDGELVFIGGGALISTKYVLTTPHIFQKTAMEALTVRLGEYDIKSDREQYKHQDVGVSDIIIHPQANYRNGFNDIAILQLQPEVTIAPNVAPICLPLSDDVFDNMRCTITGWGKNKHGKEGTYQSVMKVVDLPLVNNKKCQELLRDTKLGPTFQLYDKFRCAGGEEGFDACNGDGGGPLTCVKNFEGKEFYTLAGLVAWGIGCGEQDVPGVYIDVVQYVDWIDKELSSRG